MKKELTLTELIDSFCGLSRIHICICDQSGLWQHPLIKLGHEYRVHSKRLCSLAKTTERGLRLCLYCKNLSNKRAIEQQQPFHGHCPYGMLEVVHPVVVRSKVMAIIYIGNIVGDPLSFEKNVARITRLTGAPFDEIMAELPNTCPIENAELCHHIAEIIDQHIQHILDIYPLHATRTGRHWFTESTLQYIQENYTKNLQLSYLADIHFVNTQYAGRVFKRDMGCSFAEYLNRTRLEIAQEQLRHSTASIASIANNCGFNSLSYFTRMFKKQYATTPGEYRKKAQT